MQPEHAATWDGRRASRLRPAAAVLNERLRAVRRRHATLVQTLGETISNMHAALAARKVGGERRVDAGPVGGGNGANAGETLAVSLPLDVRAPRAARDVLEGLRGRIAPTVLVDAQLVVSELVTNSVRHSGAPPGGRVDVRIVVTDTTVRVEVGDAGRTGVVAPQPPDLELGSGFGLNLVSAVAERWGLERIATGGTLVWAQLQRASPGAGTVGAEAGLAGG